MLWQHQSSSQRIWAVMAALAGTLLFGAAGMSARPAPQTPALQQQLGSIKSINGNVITLTTDAGDTITVNVQEKARMLRVEPGQKTLQGAVPMELSDLQVGDRILVRGLPAADKKTFTAGVVIAMKRADVDAKHKQQSDDWQKRGIGGLVHSADAASGTVTISVAAAGGSKHGHDSHHERYYPAPLRPRFREI